MFEPPQIFRTDNYFQPPSVVSATDEYDVHMVNGTVASFCNSDISPSVPLNPCFINAPVEHPPEANIHERTNKNVSCSADAAVAEDTACASVLITDSLPLSDRS